MINKLNKKNAIEVKTFYGNIIFGEKNELVNQLVNATGCKDFTGIIKAINPSKSFDKSLKKRITIGWFFFKDGVLHRTDGPAIEYSNEYIAFINKKRIQYEAIQYEAINEYWLNGNKINIRIIDGSLYLGQEQDIKKFLTENGIIELPAIDGIENLV